MNKVYMVVWNVTLGTWVAVSELAKSHSKTKSKNLKSVILPLVMGMTFSSGAWAGGTDGGSVFLNCDPQNKVGNGATASQSVALGAFACAPGNQAVALGANTYAKGNSSVAIGGDDLDVVANGAAGKATGTNGEYNKTQVAQDYRTITGLYLVDVENNKQYINTKTGDAAVAIGVQSSALGALSTAFGTHSTAEGLASVALGVGSFASKDGSIALGSGSLTDGNATKVTDATIENITLANFVGSKGFAGAVSDAGRQVSVGNIGNERQIKNVAPGEVSSKSTDAINGSQL